MLPLQPPPGAGLIIGSAVIVAVVCQRKRQGGEGPGARQGTRRVGQATLPSECQLEPSECHG
jgi:hypothetical protein